MMHNLEFLLFGEKPKCFASTSLPLSEPATLSNFGEVVDGCLLHREVKIPQDAATFEVVIQKNSLGLGLSITGGPDAPAPFKHLFRIKKIFPLQPAWQTGQIRPGDILLEANHQPLTGMCLRQALDILRCSPPITTLLICRPRAEFVFTVTDEDQSINPISPRVARSYSYTPAATRQLSLSMSNADPSESMDYYPSRNFTSTPEPQQITDDNQHNSHMGLLSPVILNNNNTISSPDPSDFYGEFTISLRKVNGSLGFTLYSQNDDSTVLRHSVKALVKEPAISDGRIRPGDKLVSANGIECGHLSHEEIIQFLRKCPDLVILRFYRDASRSQTPVSTPQHPSGPSEHKKSFFSSERSKFGNFFSGSSSSHPDLAVPAVTNRHGQSKPKQLRAEAKEMVRSLQASRNSLESAIDTGHRSGSNASGSGSRRKIRPFSPARERQPLQSHPICNSASAPSPFPKHLVSTNTDSISTSPVQSPTIESPMTPALNLSVLENSGFYQTLPQSQDVYTYGLERLRIEELPSDSVLHENFSLGVFRQEPLSVDLYGIDANSHANQPHSSMLKIERPTMLDLFGHSKKKSGFIFNKSN